MWFIPNPGFSALLAKEFHQLLRNRQLLFMLVVAPIVQLCMYGFALSPEVKHMRLGVIDYSKTPAARDLVSSLVRNGVFDLYDSGESERALASRVRDGKLDCGIVIPPDFARLIKAQRQAPVQVILDGVDANTAGIAAGYINQIVTESGQEASAQRHSGGYPDAIRNNATFVYNAGLVSAWFFVPGVIGLVLNVAGIMVSSATLLIEKETGTLEQLLMTPVTSAEILIAKIVPLTVVLFVNILIGLWVGMGIFHMPFRGNPLSLFVISFIYVFVVMSVGIALSTISENQRQAMLISFFVNMPVIQLSGAIAPLESMPPFFQTLSMINPLRYYIQCLKGILLKGVGLDVLWPEVLILSGFAFVLLTLSAARFRRQMA